MIRYIEIGKLVRSNKEVVKVSCCGSWPIFWLEVKAYYLGRKEFEGFDKNDWYGAYDRALCFDDMSIFTHEVAELNAVARYFLLGLSHKGWVKHFDREGFNRACQPFLRPKNGF